MANAWSGHFYNEAQQHKVIYEQVSEAYKQYETQWNNLHLEAVHWTEIADTIRWANEMAKVAFSSGYHYFTNMIEHQKEGSIFGAKKRMESFANANKHIAEWTRAAVAKWDKLAADYGVTLVDQNNKTIEISLMADAALLDVQRYIGSKWSSDEANKLSKQIREKYQVSDEEFEKWRTHRNINGGSN